MVRRSRSTIRMENGLVVLFKRTKNPILHMNWFSTLHSKPVRVCVSYSTLLQASCDLCLCIPAGRPCRTKQLLIVTHTQARILAHARTNDTLTLTVPSLSVYQSQVSGSWPLRLCHARISRHYCFLIAGEGCPYHRGNCRGIYWGGGSWAAVAVGTWGGSFPAARSEMSFKSLKDLGVSAERIGSFCKRWMNRAQRSVSFRFIFNLFFLSVAPV